MDSVRQDPNGRVYSSSDLADSSHGSNHTTAVHVAVDTCLRPNIDSVVFSTDIRQL